MHELNKDRTLAALEEFSGLEFVYIPSGTYTVGIPKAAAHLALDHASGLSFGDYVPETKVTLEPFFISSKPVCLSHWHKLLHSPFSDALKNTITYDEIDLHYYNLLPNNKQGYGYGFKAFLKGRHEIDPPLTLSITKSFQFAKALGVSLPYWAQWEAASRGREGFLFPWGNTFDLTQVRLSYYRYSYVWEDPESDMGLGRDHDYISGKKCRIDDF
ncbi:MAG TPA: SUMF1/EgtB/PvdO family nonheme iron enzyme, partial [Candidatus Obscuribacterales bacterium]